MRPHLGTHVRCVLGLKGHDPAGKRVCSGRTGGAGGLTFRQRFAKLSSIRDAAVAKNTHYPSNLVEKRPTHHLRDNLEPHRQRAPSNRVPCVLNVRVAAKQGEVSATGTVDGRRSHAGAGRVAVDRGPEETAAVFAGVPRA